MGEILNTQLKIPQISLHYGTEGFKEGPQLGSHYAKKAEASAERIGTAWNSFLCVMFCIENEDGF